MTKDTVPETPKTPTLLRLRDIFAPRYLDHQEPGSDATRSYSEVTLYKALRATLSSELLPPAEGELGPKILGKLQDLHQMYPKEFEHDSRMLLWMGYLHWEVNKDFAAAMQWFDKYLRLAGTDNEIGEEIDGNDIGKEHLPSYVSRLLFCTTYENTPLDHDQMSALYALCIEHMRVPFLPANYPQLSTYKQEDILEEIRALASRNLNLAYRLGWKDFHKLAADAFLEAYAGDVNDPRSGKEPNPDILADFIAACKSSGQDPHELLQKFWGNPLRNTPRPPLPELAFG